MARRELSDRKREEIKALLATGLSKNEIAKRCEVSWDTVRRIEQENKDEIESYREEKKREFIDQIWQDMRDALELGRQKIHLAKVAINEFQPTIDKLVELLEKNEDTNGKDIIELIKALSSITNIPLSHISTYFGTLYDKQALMNNENTQNIGHSGGIEVVIQTPGVVSEDEWNADH